MTFNDFEWPITAISRYKQITVACTFILSKPCPVIISKLGPLPQAYAVGL